MRIAIIMRSVGYLRNYEAVIRQFAEKGHVILLYFDRDKKPVERMEESSDKVAQHQLEQMVRDHGKIKYHGLDSAYAKPTGLVSLAALRIRLIRDYARYFAPQFENADRLRDRAGSFLAWPTRLLVRTLARTRWSRRVMVGALERFERLIPPRPDVMEFLRRIHPDILMVTPLLGHGSSQIDYFKAAAALGIRSALPVASWDNLTSKGVMQCQPNTVLVWNEAQKREAVELQDVEPQRIHVTGAYAYEHWFKWQPSTEKAAFQVLVGLDPARGYVVFLGSSGFIAEDEPQVILRWARALRTAGDPRVRDIGILIRPHPQNYGSWRSVDVSGIGNAVIFPRGSANHFPVGHQAKSEYFDTMYHCRAVVGVNTSGMIEAAILKKPVHTVLFEEMAATQEGTLHFRHLSVNEGGLLRVARNLDEHVALLGASLTDPTADIARSKAFVRRFVWPDDLPTKTMVGAFVAAVTKQVRQPPPVPVRTNSFARWAGRIALAPLLVLCLPELVRLAIRRRGRRRQIQAARARALQVAERQ